MGSNVILFMNAKNLMSISQKSMKNQFLRIQKKHTQLNDKDCIMDYYKTRLKVPNGNNENDQNIIPSVQESYYKPNDDNLTTSIQTNSFCDKSSSANENKENYLQCSLPIVLEEPMVKMVDDDIQKYVASTPDAFITKKTENMSNQTSNSSENIKQHLCLMPLAPKTSKSINEESITQGIKSSENSWDLCSKRSNNADIFKEQIVQSLTPSVSKAPVVKLAKKGIVAPVIKTNNYIDFKNTHNTGNLNKSNNQLNKSWTLSDFSINNKENSPIFYNSGTSLTKIKKSKPPLNTSQIVSNETQWSTNTFIKSNASVAKNQSSFNWNRVQGSEKCTGYTLQCSMPLALPKNTKMVKIINDKNSKKMLKPNNHSFNFQQVFKRQPQNPAKIKKLSNIFGAPATKVSKHNTFIIFKKVESAAPNKNNVLKCWMPKTKIKQEPLVKIIYDNDVQTILKSGKKNYFNSSQKSQNLTKRYNVQPKKKPLNSLFLQRKAQIKNDDTNVTTQQTKNNQKKNFTKSRNPEISIKDNCIECWLPASKENPTVKVINRQNNPRHMKYKKPIICNFPRNLPKPLKSYCIQKVQSTGTSNTSKVPNNDFNKLLVTQVMENYLNSTNSRTFNHQNNKVRSIQCWIPEVPEKPIIKIINKAITPKILTHIKPNTLNFSPKSPESINSYNKQSTALMSNTPLHIHLQSYTSRVTKRIENNSTSSLNSTVTDFPKVQIGTLNTPYTFMTKTIENNSNFTTEGTKIPEKNKGNCINSWSPTEPDVKLVKVEKLHQTVKSKNNFNFNYTSKTNNLNKCLNIKNKKLASTAMSIINNRPNQVFHKPGTRTTKIEKNTQIVEREITEKLDEIDNSKFNVLTKLRAPRRFLETKYKRQLYKLNSRLQVLNRYFRMNNINKDTYTLPKQSINKDKILAKRRFKRTSGHKKKSIKKKKTGYRYRTSTTWPLKSIWGTLGWKSKYLQLPIFKKPTLTKVYSGSDVKKLGGSLRWFRFMRENNENKIWKFYTKYSSISKPRWI